MSNKEEKKNISGVGILKKTESQSNKTNEEIGVEADIPMEEESQSDNLNITNHELKLNTDLVDNKAEGTLKPEDSEVVSSGIGLGESRVKVFDVSSGRVVEKDVLKMVRSPEDIFKDSKRRGIDVSTVEAQRKAQSATKTTQVSTPKIWLILAAALALLILILYFIFYDKEDSAVRQEGSSSPTINLSK